MVEVGWPDQLRRYVFTDAGAALRACADAIRGPAIHIKAAVAPEHLRAALPSGWRLEQPRYLMLQPAAMPGRHALPAGYSMRTGREHGAEVLRFHSDAGGQAVAASGRIVLHAGCAVFDRIETHEAHRGKGLGKAMMAALGAIAEHAGANERLLVATEGGRRLYTQLGWLVLTPYSTAVSA